MWITGSTYLPSPPQFLFGVIVTCKDTHIDSSSWLATVTRFEIEIYQLKMYSTTQRRVLFLLKYATHFPQYKSHFLQESLNRQCWNNYFTRKKLHFYWRFLLCDPLPNRWDQRYNHNHQQAILVTCKCVDNTWTRKNVYQYCVEYHRLKMVYWWFNHYIHLLIWNILFSDEPCTPKRLTNIPFHCRL